MNFWLVKTEPGEYGWKEHVRDKITPWTGVRNYQARNFMMEMKEGERVLFYHSGKEPQIVGVSRVVRSAYPEAGTEKWSVVDLKPESELKHPVSRSRLKSSEAFTGSILFRNSRLSVMPLSKEEFDEVLKISNGQ